MAAPAAAPCLFALEYTFTKPWRLYDTDLFIFFEQPTQRRWPLFSSFVFLSFPLPCWSFFFFLGFPFDSWLLYDLAPLLSPFLVSFCFLFHILSIIYVILLMGCRPKNISVEKIPELHSKWMNEWMSDRLSRSPHLRRAMDEKLNLDPLNRSGITRDIK